MPDSGFRRQAALIAAALALVLVIAGALEAGLHHSSSPAGTASATGSRSATHLSGTRLPPAGTSASSSAAGQVPANPVDAIGGLLARRATAIKDGDRTAWLAPLDPSATPANRFQTAQRNLFDRVRSLRPVSWSYQVLGGSALPAKRRAALGGQAWLADVQLTYQLAEHGTPVQREQFLTIVQRAGSWRISTDTDGPTARDIWDLGPITHVSAARCLVIGTALRHALVATLAAECGRAAGTVDAAWGKSWARRTVLIIPNTLAQLAVLLGRRTGAPASTGSAGEAGADATAGLKLTAAVTIGPSNRPADEVLINGSGFDQLLAIGRRVVLTHELVHVATRATGSDSAPTWVEEGFADYVAYRATDLPPDQVAGDALNAVRHGHLPSRLPDDDDFNAAGGDAATAYGQAWVAVRLIADRAGSLSRMKAFYQRAAAGEETPNQSATGSAMPGPTATSQTAPDPTATGRTATGQTATGQTATGQTAQTATGQTAQDRAVDAALKLVGIRGGLAAFVPLWQARLRELARAGG